MYRVCTYVTHGVGWMGGWVGGMAVLVFRVGIEGGWVGGMEVLGGGGWWVLRVWVGEWNAGVG